MQLTGKQIVKNGIVGNYCEKGVQQQGVDVRIEALYSLDINSYGCVPAEGKTTVPTCHRQVLSEGTTVVSPGYYEVELMESCKIPSDAVLNFKTRSSLVRCGALVHSGQFDAGFETEKMGCYLQVLRPILLEKGARIAQAIVTLSYPVEAEDLYNGQFQNDKQRG